MHFPPLTTEECDEFLLVKQKARCFALQLGAEIIPEQRMTCHFLEQTPDESRDMNALVLAPDMPLLTHRIVSFLGAHLRIGDRTGLEKNILNGISSQLERQPGHSPTTPPSSPRQSVTPFP
ncbi:MAG: hypothetical protein KDI44_17100 [Thiothrix sp.]|nr:hypothetical protein [Thiothrix sp.]HPQ95100.1 hypothetical protein [Thiolinea sp.]